MVRVKEYRICMPLTVEEYQIGQLYMVARHSLEQSAEGEGVEVIENSECEDHTHGLGQYTEKRLHLSSRLPYWLRALCPRVFYITEKSWNYYPYTITEYTCSFIPKLNVSIVTKFEDNNGSTENSLELSEEELKLRTIDHVDIAYDDLNNCKVYKKEEDPKSFKSMKTGRGPLIEGWRELEMPIMCSYKVVKVSFEVWGLQTKVEDYILRAVRDVLLLGHRQAFAWIDHWYDMTLDDVRDYEKLMQNQTNQKLLHNMPATAAAAAVAADETTETTQQQQQQIQQTVDFKVTALEDVEIVLPKLKQIGGESSTALLINADEVD